MPEKFPIYKKFSKEEIRKEIASGMEERTEDVSEMGKDMHDDIDSKSPRDIIDVYRDEANEMDGEFKANKAEKYELIHSFEAELIKSKIKEIVELSKNNAIKAVIFLDKSARPISWVFSAVSRAVLNKESCPEIKFLNIGMEKEWLDDANSQKEMDENIENMPEFNFLKEQWENLRDKNILIVDEYVNTGGSLRRAKKILQKMIEPKKIWTECID